MQLLLVGATGLVGGHLLSLALADARVTRVIAPVRRALPDAADPKLTAPQVDFDALPPDADWWRSDAVCCALGTTIAVAGSQDAFRRVDHAYPLAVARLARDAGTPAYVLNSARGADADSRIFYSRVKGELERDLRALAFPSLTLVRPGLIGGERTVRRPAEHAASLVLGALRPVLPRAWRINPAVRIAQAMLDAAVAATPGVHTVESDALN